MLVNLQKLANSQYSSVRAIVGAERGRETKVSLIDDFLAHREPKSRASASISMAVTGRGGCLPGLSGVT